jgi:hypothetical protein
VALGIVEEADLDALHRLVRAHHPRPAEALGLRERRLDVGDLDVEGDVAGIPLRARSDAAADSHAVRVGVPLALHDPVLHRVARVDLPPEELGVVTLELVGVLPDDLEVDNWLSHNVSFSARCVVAPGTPAEFNRVGVLEVGPARPKNGLVLSLGQRPRGLRLRGRGGCAARSSGVISLIVSLPLATSSRICASFSRRRSSARSFWVFTSSLQSAVGHNPQQ